MICGICGQAGMCRRGHRCAARVGRLGVRRDGEEVQLSSEQLIEYVDHLPSLNVISNDSREMATIGLRNKEQGARLSA
jgi:hypothetical protein